MSIFVEIKVVISKILQNVYCRTVPAYLILWSDIKIYWKFWMLHVNFEQSTKYILHVTRTFWRYQWRYDIRKRAQTDYLIFPSVKIIQTIKYKLMYKDYKNVNIFSFMQSIKIKDGDLGKAILSVGWWNSVFPLACEWETQELHLFKSQI